MLESLTEDTFTPHLGSLFRVQVDSGDVVEMKLVEVTSLGARGKAQSATGAPRRQPFSVLWRGPRDRPLPQGTYRLEHEALEKMEIFIVPIGPDEEGLCYEAIFA